MLETPQIVHAAAQMAAVIHITVPRSEIRNVMGPGLAELKAAVARQGIFEAGPWFAHHLKMDHDTFDFEIGVPVSKPVTPTGRVVPGELPAARVARTVFHGDFEGLPNAWRDFDEWIRAEGHTARSDLWERYLAGPDASPDPARWRTELNRPLVG